MSSLKYSLKNFEIVCSTYDNKSKEIYNKIELECLFTFNLDDKDNDQENIDIFYLNPNKIENYLLFSEYRYKINIDFKSIENKLKEDGYKINKYNFNPNIICIPIETKSIIKAKGNKDNERISNIFKEFSLLDNNESEFYSLRINEITEVYKSKDFSGKIIFPPYSFKLNLEIIEKFPYIYKEYNIYKLMDLKYCYKFLNNNYICKCKDENFIPNNNISWLNQNPLYIKTVTVVS